MTERSLPAILALALGLAALPLLLSIGPAPAGAQDANVICPQTLPSTTTKLTCACSGADGSRVWGSDFYTDDSNLCNAAVHAGAIPASGGLLTVRAETGLESYTGSTRNGVTSRDYGRWGRTIMFDFNSDYANVEACPATYNAKGTGWAGICRCTGKEQGAVWGSDPYTADSNLCEAARHAGVIGGRITNYVVRVLPAPGKDGYNGSDRNRVVSRSWGPYGASFTVRQ